MIRTILLSSVVSGALAALAPTAEAGGFDFRFGIGDRNGNTVSVTVGDRDNRGVERRGRGHPVSTHRGHGPEVHRHPAPVIHRHPAPRVRVVTERVWVAGHYDRVAYEVRIPGGTSRVKVPARYEWRTDIRGGSYRVLISPSHYETVCEPDRIETRYKMVFHPGHYETQTRTIRS
jgi:hypothetical protein